MISNTKTSLSAQFSALSLAQLLPFFRNPIVFVQFLKKLIQEAANIVMCDRIRTGEVYTIKTGLSTPSTARSRTPTVHRFYILIYGFQNVFLKIHPIPKLLKHSPIKIPYPPLTKKSHYKTRKIHHAPHKMALTRLPVRFSAGKGGSRKICGFSTRTGGILQTGKVFWLKKFEGVERRKWGWKKKR